MNNATVKDFSEPSNEDSKKEILLRQRTEELTSLIESLNALYASSHYRVLRQFVFDVDLDKAKRRLVVEKDTTEIFRLQGEIRWGEKFSLETLIKKYRDELSAIIKK